MRASVKFILTAVAVCLTIGVLMVGVFAATSGNMQLTSLVKWQSIGVEMDIHGKVTGNHSGDAIASTYEDSLTLANDSKSSAWSIGAMNFVMVEDSINQVRYSKPIVMRFGFTNNSTHKVNIYYYFAEAPTVISNVNYEYQSAHGTLGSGETWESDFFNANYSGNMSVSGVSDKYYSVHKDTEQNFVAPGETVVFEIRFTVATFTQSISTAALTTSLVFQNSPREGGTIVNPYIIADEEDFNIYATSAYMGNPDMYFLQTADLAFNSTSTAQSVSALNANAVSANNSLPVIDLLGHYDGGGNTIDLTGTNSPLFNNVGSSSVTTASLSNLNVYNESSTANCGVVTNVYGTLDGVTFDGEITPSLDAGGITYMNYGKIKNCINYADISSTADIGSYIGGIASMASGVNGTNIRDVYFENCANYGTMSGNVDCAGGMVTFCIASSDTNVKFNYYFTNCFNAGAIYAIGAAGGLVGCGDDNVYITNSYNSGSISGDRRISGIIYYEDDLNSLTIQNSFNLGTISAPGSEDSYAITREADGVTVTNSYYLSTCGAAGAGTAISLEDSQDPSNWSGFSFGSYGTATTGWVFASAYILIDGVERCLWLPRLAFEDLTHGQPEVIGPDSPEGGGSDGNAYTIASAADFVKYATETSATGIGFANPDIAFKQTADITLTETDFVTSTLLADYDGGGYTLALAPSGSNAFAAPLFTAIGSSSSTSIDTNLKNLTVGYGSSAMLSSVVTGFARDIYYARVENVHAISQNTVAYISLPSSDQSITPKNLGSIAYKSANSEFIGCSNNVVTNSSITYLGGIVGNATNSKFSGCWNENSSTSTTNFTVSYMGGIVGYADGCEFNYCWNTADISANSSSVYIGGIVGFAYTSAIKNCYNTGDISNSSTEGYLAGIVGSFNGKTSSHTIENCYNTGNIPTDTETTVGAIAVFVGCSPAGEASTWNVTIKNCYNTGTANSLVHDIGTAHSDYVTNLTMLNCYNLASSSWYVSNTGVINNTTITTTNCISIASSVLSSQTQSTFTNAGWTFGTYGSAKDGWVWRTANIVVEGTTYSYSLPRLWYEGLAASNVMNMLAVSAGSGTQSDPYTIASASDFNKYAAVTSTTGIGFANPNIAFKQTADITSSSLTVANLAATYDGQNYTINTTGRSKAVFIEITGTLKNLTVRNTSYTPGENLSNQYDSAGVACQLSGGTMKNVHFTGTVSASNTSAYFGGLLEILDTGTIDGCSNSATITINLGTSGVWAKAGGLVQTAWGGTIKNSWNTGAITAVAWGYEGSPASGGCYYNGYAGGLIADGSVQSMKNCYNTGSISANGYVGGLIGSGGAPFENCYNTGWITSAGFSPSGGYTVYPGSTTFGEGGFIGSAFNTSFTNCFAAGVVTGKLPGAFVGTSSSASSITESGCYRLTSTNYNVPTDSYVSSTSRSHGSSGTAHTQSNWSWTFGTAGTATDGWVWVTDEIVINGEELTYALPRLWFEAASGGGTSIESGVKPTIYIDGVEQTNVAVAGTTVGDYLDALDGSQYPGYFYDEDLTIYADEDDIVTYDTKLYTKSATLDKLTFTSNGDGTCSVVKNGTPTGEVVIPQVSPAGDSVTSMGQLAFSDCESLTSVTIPNSVTSIGSYAFSYCDELISISIPNSVTSIGSQAFLDCTSLTSITIGDGVTSIGSNVFYGCSCLTSIIVSGGNTIYDSRNNCNAIIKTASNTLIAGCNNTVIPNNVTSIGNYAFGSCTSLTSITIPDSVTSIGSNAFYVCTSLTSIVVSGGNTIYDSRNNCNAIIETASNTLIAGCKNTVIPDNVTSIGDYAFHGCSGLTSITIPDGVTSIGSDAFSGCSGLTSITIPDSVTSIGDNAFFACESLTSITIPDGVTSIGDWAFSGCSGLTSITIPDSVTSIGDNAFFACESLTSIYIPSSVTRISAYSYSDSPFYYCSSSLKIYCGASSKPSGWGTYWNYRTTSATYTPTWGVTREQYNSQYA